MREAERLVEALAIARNEAQRLNGQATRLHDGQVKLADGGAKLHKGAAKLAGATGQLPGALGKLEGGASQLVDGLGQLRGGADTLEERLAEGFHRSRPLQTKLHQGHVEVSVSARQVNRKVDRLRHNSPGIFNSGYFVLSSLAGAPAKERKRVAGIVDLENGGQAAQMIVIPRYTFNTTGSTALNERLKKDADGLAAATGATTGVTGAAAELIDYTNVISERIPLDDRGDHARHLPDPGRHPAGAAAGGDRGGAQPGHGRRRLRRPHPALRRPRRLAAGRPHLRRRDRRGGDLRDHLRPLDRLRGVPA